MGALDKIGTPFAPPEEQPPEWTRSSAPGGLSSLDDLFLNAQLRLENASAGVPRDQLLDDFRQRVLQWAPSHEAYRRAREEQDRASQEMLSLTAPEPFDDRSAWLRFAAGMGRPTRTGHFMESLGYGLEGYTDAYEKAKNRYLAQRSQRAQLGYTAAKDRVESERRAMTDSLTGVAKIAALERVNQLLARPGAMSDLEKRVRAMGHDPVSPDGKRVMMQLHFMQHGTPEIKDTISEFPDLIPGTPEFSEAMAKRLGVKLRGKEQQITASQSAASLAEQRATNLAAELDRERARGQQIGADPVLAGQLGTIISPVDPYAPLSGKARESFYEKMQKEYEKDANELAGKAEKAREFGQDARRALDILAEPKPEGGWRPRIITGGVLAAPGVAAVASALHPGYSELRAIQNKIAPMLRVAGSGAMSDFDARTLLSSTFGPEKLFETNVNLALGYVAAAKRISDYQDARERYFMANKHTQGFDQIWKKYVDTNRLLSEDRRTGVLQFNRGIPTFAEWLAKNRARTLPGTPGLAPAKDSTGG